ncbi:MAG: hypothetical protein ACTHLW_21165 [Verrucomicrobiota bacterium]
MRRIITIAFCALCGSVAAQGIPPFPVVELPPHLLTLTWDMPADPNIAGANVYQGAASRTYTNKVDCGMTNRVTVEVSDGTNYFAVTAYNLLGVESDYSQEVSYAPLVPIGPTNVIVTLLVPLEFSTDLIHWNRTNAVVGVFTNPAAPMQFWRAPGLQVKAEIQ